MKYFEYSLTDPSVQYYEILESLIERWEFEIVEFKEAKGQYDTDKAGRYFSAISNEANLKHQQFGWFILGVSEKGKVRHIVGTNFKQGEGNLERFKYEVARGTTGEISFIDIIELTPIVDGRTYRVLMFQIPAAVTGIPTGWKGNYYARAGESLLALPQFKIDMIRSQTRQDWSKQLLNGATCECLDKEAVAIARQKYKEKMNKEYISKEIDHMTDEQFLTKLKLMIGGKLTAAAMLLLGNPDYDYLFASPPTMMWRLYGADGKDLDYELYTIPFINVIDKIFLRIRNLKYRYMPNQMTLFPEETQQYNMWLLRELLNNCIAHSNYQLGGRIYINEFEDRIKITNPGDFLPRDIKAVLEVSYNPPFYRNQLLAETMNKLCMIDTATMGIRKVFRIQKEKYFPMPDYDLSNESQVAVTIYGKTLNENYMHILYDNPNLDLQTVFLLDQVQKGRKLSKESVDYLRKLKLVEGKMSNLYLSSAVAKSIDNSAQYIKNKGFDDQYYKDLIVQYLEVYHSARKKDIRALLWEKLPEALSDQQKEYKIGNLLASLKRAKVIKPSTSNQQKNEWILSK
ncbi:MAG: ATP-binding protein [Eubacteriales bacterium]|nr:ATP-binding protein [Eubacteriales bacterium]